MKYKIDFSYSIPEWGTVELEADNDEAAEILTEKYISELYPEAEEYSIDSIEVVNS